MAKVDLLAALTGSAIPGQYPDTIHDRLDAALNEAWIESANLNIALPTSGSDPGPFTYNGTVDASILDQGTARFGTTPKARTLVEKATLLEALIKGIYAHPGSNPPPATSSGITPDPTHLLWQADFTKGDVLAAGFGSTPWNTETGPSWPPPIGTYAGRKAIKFQLGSGGKRIEVQPPDAVNSFPSTGDKYFRFEFYLESDFPLSAQSWHVIWQLHGNDTTSPKLDLEAHKGGLTIADNTALVPLSKQVWYKVVVHADFTNGRMSTWLNDLLVHDNISTGKSNPNYYLKCGSYQDTAIGAGTLYQTNHKLGTTYNSVAA